MSEFINNNPLRLSNGKVDKLLLKENKLIYSKFYLFGCHASHELFELRHKVLNGFNNAKLNYKLIYAGESIGIKSFQLARILDTVDIHGNHPTKRFKDYTEERLPVGLPVKVSFITALTLYQRNFGYVPKYCLVVQVMYPQS